MASSINVKMTAMLTKRDGRICVDKIAGRLVTNMCESSGNGRERTDGVTVLHLTSSIGRESYGAGYAISALAPMSFWPRWTKRRTQRKPARTQAFRVRDILTARWCGEIAYVSHPSCYRDCYGFLTTARLFCICMECGLICLI
jgi:hypothetical protein